MLIFLHKQIMIKMFFFKFGSNFKFPHRYFINASVQEKFETTLKKIPPYASSVLSYNAIVTTSVLL